MARALSRNGQQRGERSHRTPARRGSVVAWLTLTLTALVLCGCTKILGDFKLTDKTQPVVDAGKDAGLLDIIVTPEDGLQTTEWGGRTSFTIVLRTAPRANVAIALSTMPMEEGSVSPESVTFTPANWNAPQTVYVTGKQDDFADGNTIFTVVTSPASTEDPHYNGMDPPDVAVLNIDDETPGFMVSPLSGLKTTEGGGAATFTVALTAPPANIVTVELSSSNTKEGKVSPSTLAFSPSNYRSPQTVTVTGQDDSDVDGAKQFQIVTLPAKSSDLAYDGLNPPDVQVTNVDDESAGVTVTPVAGLFTSENGRTATFTIVLDTQPTADVNINVSSNNAKEATVAPARLTFTTANWRAPQTVTVTGLNDDDPDGNQPYKVVIGAVDSGDARYKGIDPDDLDLINIDNDSAGLIVTPLDGLVTSEDGLAATFSVVLAAKPAGDVAIDFTSSAPGEGTANPRRIAFTSVNWNAPQIITVSGVDDMTPTMDGDAVYQVRGLVDVTSSDPDYGTLPDFVVNLVNLDNETPGVTITPRSGLTTTETGGKAIFTVALRSKPSGDVRIDLASSNAMEGTVFPASLTFTSVNFAAPQKVTVTGADDMEKDGPQPYMVVTAPAVSTDDGYKNLDAPNVTVVNLDDDTPNVIVVKGTDLTTTESGGTATFTLALTTAPKSDVAVNLSSTDASEGEVFPGIITFTPTNWNAPQTVTATGKDDALADGAQPYRIVIAPTSSSDIDYQGIDADDVAVTNLDDETASVIVSADMPLITTEMGGSATFGVALGSPPMSPVTILLSSSRPGEGAVSPIQMIFNSTNWRSPQVATVTGIDDMAADGNQPYTIMLARTSSLDAAYNNLKPPDVAVVNLDNESAGVNVVARRGLTTTESGGTAQFTVALNSVPSSDITIALRSTNPAEGTPSPTGLTFTSANWTAPQTVTVTGVDDMVADGARSYRIVLDPPKGDPAYALIDPSDVELTNLDNDAPAIIVIPPKVPTTTEFGGTTSFGVYLLAAPTDTVTLPLVSSNPGEGVLSRSSLTFTTANWATPQWVTVAGVDDMAVADGDTPYKIAVGPASGTPSGYAGRRGNDVLLVNLDNDTAGLLVTPVQGPTTEGGIATNFTVMLTTKPTATVTVPIVSARPTEGMALVASLVFTPLNWNAPQSVTVRGIDDKVVDGDQIYRIQVGPSTSGDSSNPGGDPNYKGKRAKDVLVTNLDDDGGGIRVTAAPDLRTTETGGAAKFAVALATAPTDNVTLSLVSRDPGEGKITDPSSGTLVFTAANWSVAQTVTVTGVDDSVADGNALYAIHFQPAMSNDARYTNRTADDVWLTNIDDDSPGVTVTAAPNLTTTEGGGTATFGMVLNMAPTQGVTFVVHSSNTAEGTVSPGLVEFSVDDWNLPHVVTVTGQQDSVIDGNQVYAVVIDPAQSSDPGYREFVVDSIPVTNIDDDMTPATLPKQRRTNARPRRATGADISAPK